MFRLWCMIAEFSESSPVNVHPRLLGSAFLFFTLASVIHFGLIDNNLIVPRDINQVIDYIRSQEVIFRSGIILDVIVFASAAFLSVLLYLTIRRNHSIMALTALVMVMVQVSLAITIELSSFMTLFLTNSAYSGSFQSSEISGLLKISLEVRRAGYSLSLIFFASGLILFLWGFWKSRLITKGFCLWGIVSFLLMLFGTCINIVSPETAKSLAIKSIITIASSSAILFQLVLGFWLMAKGFNSRSVVKPFVSRS